MLLGVEVVKVKRNPLVLDFFAGTSTVINLLFSSLEILRKATEGKGEARFSSARELYKFSLPVDSFHKIHKELMHTLCRPFSHAVLQLTRRKILHCGLVRSLNLQSDPQWKTLNEVSRNCRKLRTS